MLRRIIKIDEEKCTGCGACVDACHEGAIALIDGKARLIREDYCDGLGDCLPICPADAISFEERDAPAYNDAAVAAAKRAVESETARLRASTPQTAEKPPIQPLRSLRTSELRQWPCQIKLAPLTAPYYANADLLIAADCTAYAYADIHRDFMRGRVTLIGCPKLDAVDYGEKIGEILKRGSVRSVTVLRMEVPCCRGLENAVKRAIAASGKAIPATTVTISTDGKIIE